MENQPLWCCFEGFVWHLRLLVASVPSSPAGGCDRACLPLNLVVCCSSAGGAELRVLASWGPLLVPGSLYFPATEILSFFLGSFEVVDEGFLPPTAGRSFIEGTSACSGPLLRVTATSLDFGLATAVFRYGSWFTLGYGWSPVFPSFGSGGRRRLVYPWRFVHRPEFISGRSWPFLDFPLCGGFGGLVQVFSCLALSVSVGVLSDFSPADFSSLWLCLVERINLGNFLGGYDSARVPFRVWSWALSSLSCLSPFLGHSPFHRWWRPSLFGKH